MLKTAENIVLRNGGERIVLTCGAEQEAMVAELGKRPEQQFPEKAPGSAIQLIAPAEDGLIHDDDDFRTPLRRITCPRWPIRSMATTTRISPETSWELRARQPARLLVPVPPETPTSRKILASGTPS